LALAAMHFRTFPAARTDLVEILFPPSSIGDYFDFSHFLLLFFCIIFSFCSREIAGIGSPGSQNKKQKNKTIDHQPCV
jgi:hypothetical protein